MLYNVSQLLREPIGSTRRLALDGVLTEGAGDSIVGRAEGTLLLVRVHHGLLLNASVEVLAGVDCARCLTEFERRSTLDIEEECYPTIDPQTGRKMFPPDEAEGVVHIDTRQILDLSDVLRQYLLTTEPLKSLCRPDCRGLCPECGANLNLEKCTCAEIIDPRWAALTELLPRGN